MKELTDIQKEAEKLLESINDLNDLEKVRLRMLGRKGSLTVFLRSLKDVPLEERKKVGPKAHELKETIEQTIRDLERSIKEREMQRQLERERIDVTRPGVRREHAGLHPLARIERRAVRIFERMGFSVVEGPDIETEHYNFDALNIPRDHPARDMWDTFWLKDGGATSEENRLLLRTHTSPVQVRYMEEQTPPLRIVVPGSVFRYEAIDATHNIQFRQLEGLLVDHAVSVANFKAMIESFFEEFFGTQKKENPEVRLRPSYFPFVEPGFEVDVWHNGVWLEMLGAGMVHPNVYKAAGLHPDEWQGFAFGLGVDRLAMVHYGIDDIRLLYENDVRFLRQL